MTEHVNVNGSWKEVSNTLVNVGGSWKEVVSKKVFKGSSWLEYGQSTPPMVFEPATTSTPSQFYSFETNVSTSWNKVFTNNEEVYLSSGGFLYKMVLGKWKKLSAILGASNSMSNERFVTGWGQRFFAGSYDNSGASFLSESSDGGITWSTPYSLPGLNASSISLVGGRASAFASFVFNSNDGFYHELNPGEGLNFAALSQSGNLFWQKSAYLPSYQGYLGVGQSNVFLSPQPQNSGAVFYNGSAVSGDKTCLHIVDNNATVVTTTVSNQEAYLLDTSSLSWSTHTTPGYMFDAVYGNGHMFWIKDVTYPQQDNAGFYTSVGNAATALGGPFTRVELPPSTQGALWWSGGYSVSEKRFYIFASDSNIAAYCTVL
jgi:hypothetical protein